LLPGILLDELCRNGKHERIVVIVASVLLCQSR
jgi:hypothetical protein